MGIAEIIEIQANKGMKTCVNPKEVDDSSGLYGPGFPPLASLSFLHQVLCRTERFSFLGAFPINSHQFNSSSRKPACLNFQGQEPLHIWKKALGLSRSDAKLGVFGMQMQETASTTNVA